MCESYGRKSTQTICDKFKTKTIEEIETYSEAFWKNFEKIENGLKYVERIQKGEEEIEKLRLIDEAIETKFQGKSNISEIDLTGIPA